MIPPSPFLQTQSRDIGAGGSLHLNGQGSVSPNSQRIKMLTPEALITDLRTLGVGESKLSEIIQNGDLYCTYCGRPVEIIGCDDIVVFVACPLAEFGDEPHTEFEIRLSRVKK